MALKTHVALLGCGAVSRLYYAPALRELETSGLLQVTALLDPSPQHAAALQRSFPKAQVIEDLSKLLSLKFDLAIVASPHSQHAAQTVRLLEAGVSVLCEKPMATRLADAQAMARAAAAAPGLLAIGLVRRFFPATQMIQRMLSQRMLGDIVSFEFSEGDASFNWPVASTAYFKKQQAHGGVLMDIGVHALDLLLWWLGEPVQIDYADDAMGGIEANCLIHCQLAGGAKGEVRLSRDCALANRCTVRGTHGWVSWQVNEANRFELGLESSQHTIDAGVRAPASDSFEQSFLSQLRNVIAAVRGAEALLVPAAAGLPSIELIDRCYRQRSLMAMPWLDEHEAARGRELNAT